MMDAPRRLVMLHSRSTPRGARHHMAARIADHLAERGTEIIHLQGTDVFVPADAVFVHVDLSVLPQAYAQFAQRYPLQLNARAQDIRKRVYADGLLERGEAYDGPVIVKTDLNYGGAPEHFERSPAARMARRLARLLRGAPAPVIRSKADYRVFAALADVPQACFTPENVVQKLVVEMADGKHVLREYLFLGDLHYENIERSGNVIITEDEHVSCRPFVPHPRLLAVRRKLNLDYGKIDYVMAGGEPFIFDANKTPGIGAAKDPDELSTDMHLMLEAFAGEMLRLLNTPDAASVTEPGA
ncbi:MAG: hypothetical protein ACK4P2_04530 [Hyphomonas sp.]